MTTLNETFTVSESHTPSSSSSNPIGPGDREVVMETSSVTCDPGEGGEAGVTSEGGAKSEGGVTSEVGGTSEGGDAGEGGVASDPGEGGVTSDPGEGGVTSEDGVSKQDGEVSASGDRVQKLKTIVRQYQEVLYRHKDLSQFMSGDVLKVAEKCWQQIHGRIDTAVKEKHDRIFEEFQAFQKLSNLDSLSKQHDHSQPAWRPSGIPNEDHLTLAGIEAKHTLLPMYQKQYEEAKLATQELQALLVARQQEANTLRESIKHEMQLLEDRTDTVLSTGDN